MGGVKGMRPWSASRTRQDIQPPRRSMQHSGTRMTYTEAQSLDEALDIIADKRNKKRQLLGNGAKLARLELDGAPKPKITLPTFKFMGNNK